MSIGLDRPNHWGSCEKPLAHCCTKSTRLQSSRQITCMADRESIIYEVLRSVIAESVGVAAAGQKRPLRLLPRALGPTPPRRQCVAHALASKQQLFSHAGALLYIPSYHCIQLWQAMVALRGSRVCCGRW
jgi:hypothetical protein